MLGAGRKWPEASMRRLIACVAGLCLGAPAFAADFGESPAAVVGDAGYRCFWIETLRATYPNWVDSPDPNYYFVPQYYPVFEWACRPDKRSTVARRPAF
jgi:hypothetical protein